MNETEDMESQSANKQPKEWWKWTTNKRGTLFHDRQNTTQSNIKYFSMFTGVGGFELGFGENFKCIGMSEFNKYSSQVLKYRFPNIKNWGDCTKINPNELPDFDMLCGGFPCQSFSIAGKRRGFEDTRGTMFFEVARILKVKRPKIVLLENVKGLLNHDKGQTFRIICEVLNGLGYIVNYEILNSKNFGVPQNRERVIIIGWHIKEIVKDGKTKKKSLLKRTILDYLFQLFLQNLKEVKKLQETKSKDWVLGYLILKEISRNPKLKEKSKKDGFMIPTEEKILELKEEDMWQNIALLLNNILEESYCELNKSIISIATKQTTDSKTYTYPELLMSILSLIVALRKSSKDLWKEMLSFLILIKENTKYARIIEKTENRIRTDNFTCYESRILQDAGRYFIIGNFRGERRPKILPFGFTDEKTTIKYYQKSKTQHSRVYETNGASPTLLLGDCTPKITNRDRSAKWSNTSPTLAARDYKEPKAVFTPNRCTVTSQDIQGVTRGINIRRLTPTECERLQGFPDGWTEFGIDEKGNKVKMSDTQRYKQMGNAVTTNVIKVIGEKLCKNQQLTQ